MMINEKGTLVWGMERYRQDVLTAFLNDLVLYERSGFPLTSDGDDPHCRNVRTLLGFFVNKATSFPAGSFFGGRLYKDFEKIEAKYKEWNEIRGSDDEAIKRRNNKVAYLRRYRCNLSKRIRRNQFALQNELDLKLVQAFYDAAEELVRNSPGIFTNLSKAAEKFADIVGQMQ